MKDGNRLIRQAHRYLRECLRSQTPPRACELANRVGLTPVQLCRAFAECFGMPPSRYLKLRQLRFALRLLENTSLTTNEIAYRAGFGTRATFFRLFREFAGATPRRFATRPERSEGSQNATSSHSEILRRLRGSG